MKEILNTIVGLRQECPEFSIETAMNGEEAIDRIMDVPCSKAMDGSQKKFDFIFLDLHMPVLDGFQVTITNLINII